jgi:2-isopropylmalate synthase
MSKYRPFQGIAMEKRRWPDRTIEKAPMWCSVDLRDGNQALVNPMGIEQKLALFDLLVKIGFKEIEVGFPSASQIEFDFIRRLIEESRIPDDVTIQVLCQARKHLVDRTFESLAGAKKAVFHIYNSTSPAHRKYTFNMTKAQIVDVAVEGVKMVKSCLPQAGKTDIVLEYSPESFSSTEPDFALEVCEAVIAEWKPTRERRIILNLPSTVECSTPNGYADQIEWMIDHFSDRKSIIVSLHPHNDRGTGIAAAELGLLAGADRIEGTLFGNGERTGNLDIMAMALNMYTQGVDSRLDFTSLTEIAVEYEKFTGMPIHPRHPYAGELVFTAFSGSHQDAIKKALDARATLNDPDALWDVPYLPIDPKDVGRTYEAIIRINSQSGKGGVAWILKERYGLDLPKAMHPEVGAFMNAQADRLGVELKPEEIWARFGERYLNQDGPVVLKEITERARVGSGKRSTWDAEITVSGKGFLVAGTGTGPIDAFVEGLKSAGVDGFKVTAFHEHALTQGSDSLAAAYVEIERTDGKRFWGCGLDASIADSGVMAVVSAVNLSLK